MYRVLTSAVALSALLGSAATAFAQMPPPAPYNPNAVYAPPPYAAPAPPPYAGYPMYDGTHTNGGGSRAYPFSQKSN